MGLFFSKKKVLLLTIIVIIGAVGGFIPALVKNLSAENDSRIAEKLIVKADFTEIAAKNLTLPVSWEYSRSGQPDFALGVKFSSLKTAFPHGNTIRVVLAGTAYISEKGVVKTSDAEMRIAMTVLPENGKLTVRDLDADTLNIFDFSEEQQNKSMEFKHNILAAVEKNLSFTLLELPSGNFELYEMTHGKIVLWVK